MERIITKHKLWNLPNEQIAKLTKGRIVKILMNNGEYKEVCIKNLLAAANPPNLFFGFLTDNNHCINLQDIDHVELK